MKLPISFLLYTASLGLVGFTGWQVYQLLPLRGIAAKNAAHLRGANKGKDEMTVGKSRGQVSADWYYTNTNRPWWEQLKKSNFIGRLPPPPAPEPGEPGGPGWTPPPPPVTPLEDIFELAVLVYDSADDGKGELSHVVVRYKPNANVQPPEWYLRETQSVPGSGGYTPPDAVRPPQRPQGNPSFNPRTNRRAGRGPSGQEPQLPIASATTGLLLQEVWVRGDDERHTPNLWPPYEGIRLVRVAPSAQSAFFVRLVPSQDDPKQLVDGPEEELWKGMTDLSQEVLKKLAEIEGRSPESIAAVVKQPGAAGAQWIDEQETREVSKNHWNVGRQDNQRFQSEDSFLEKVSFDTYVSKYSGRRGIIVKNVDPQLAARYGVAEQDVLIEVNSRPVKTQAEAIQFGKQEYKKGVRTFSTKWISNGQEIERVYQLQDK